MLDLVFFFQVTVLLNDMITHFAAFLVRIHSYVCFLLPLNNLYTSIDIHTYTHNFILSCRSGLVSKPTFKEQDE